MTDITLEQRADRLFDAMMAAPYGNACIGDVVCAETTASRLRAAWLPLIEAALRLPAGADWVLVPRVLTDEMCQAGHKAQWDAKPDGILGGEVTISLNAIYRTIFAAQLAAAPRHETGEASP